MNNLSSHISYTSCFAKRPPSSQLRNNALIRWRHTQFPLTLHSCFDAVPCSARAYWSRMSTFVCMRQASLCSCIAAVIAWSLDNVSHQCPGLISSSQAESGAPSHSRKRGWFNGTPRPPSGRAWSSHLYVVCLKAQPFPKTRREACERSRHWRRLTRHCVTVSIASRTGYRPLINLGLLAQNVPKQEVLHWCRFHNCGV